MTEKENHEQNVNNLLRARELQYTSLTVGLDDTEKKEAYELVKSTPFYSDENLNDRLRYAAFNTERAMQKPNDTIGFLKDAAGESGRALDASFDINEFIRKYDSSQPKRPEPPADQFGFRELEHVVATVRGEEQRMNHEQNVNNLLRARELQYTSLTVGLDDTEKKEAYELVKSTPFYSDKNQNLHEPNDTIGFLKDAAVESGRVLDASFDINEFIRKYDSSQPKRPEPPADQFGFRELEYVVAIVRADERMEDNKPLLSDVDFETNHSVNSIDFLRESFGSSIAPAVLDLDLKTNTVMLFAHEMMEAAQNIAGYSPDEADRLRKVLAKQDPTAIAEQREAFLSGAATNGVERGVADKLFTSMQGINTGNYTHNPAPTDITPGSLSGLISNSGISVGA